MADEMTPERQAFIADLEMVVDRLQEIRAKLVQECQEHGSEFTPVEEARWEGTFKMVRGILADELSPMLQSWKDGHQYSRKGEQIMGNED